MWFNHCFQCFRCVSDAAKRTNHYKTMMKHMHVYVNVLHVLVNVFNVVVNVIAVVRYMLRS